MKDLLPRRLRPLAALLAVLTGLVAATTFLFYGVLHFRLMLLWNMFLAGLPLVFACLVLRAEGKRSRPAAAMLFGVLWLVFFPNAPYMVTDLVHITRYDYYERGVGFLPLPQSWFGLLHLTAGIALGVLYGMISLYLLHRLVARRRGETAGWLFCGAASVLSGFAIYLGRFLRFNTWDLVTRPHRIALRAWQSLSADTALLCAVFAAMTLIPYLLFYCCLHTGAEERGR